MQLAAQIVDVGLFLASGQMLCTQAIAHQSHTVPLHTITVIVYSLLKIIDCRYHGMTTFHMRDLCHASCHADNPMICLRKVAEFCDIFMNLYESLRLCKNLWCVRSKFKAQVIASAQGFSAWGPATPCISPSLWHHSSPNQIHSKICNTERNATSKSLWNKILLRAIRVVANILTYSLTVYLTFNLINILAAYLAIISDIYPPTPNDGKAERGQRRHQFLSYLIPSWRKSCFNYPMK